MLRPPSRQAGALRLSLYLLVALASAARSSSTNRTCYFPDGTASANDYPCSDADTTHCCNAKSACLSTGYCLSAEQAPYIMSRGSCTDNSWGPGCPGKCAGTDDNPGGGMPISWMGRANNAGSPLYCCGALTVDSGSIACANDEDPFVLGAAELLFGVAILANTTTTNGTATATATAATGSGSSSSGSKASSSSVTAVGAGVGVSLGVVAVAFASWALWERRQRQKQLRAFMDGTYYPPGMVAVQPAADGAGGPFSPSGTTTGAAAGSSPANGSSTNANKTGFDAQQPLVELSAYPRQYEELAATRE